MIPIHVLKTVLKIFSIHNTPMYFFMFLRKSPFYSKASVPLPDFKEFDGIGGDERNRMRLMFAQIPFDFSFPLPD